MHRLFIYGTLKQGACRAHLLRTQRFLGEARTAPRYRLLDCGSYPALVDAFRAGKPGLPVEGEVWEVSDACLDLLEEVEGAGDLYERRRVELAGRDDHVEAYFYLRPVAGLPDCGTSWP